WQSHRLQSEQGLVSSLLIGQDVPDYDAGLQLLMRCGDPDVIYLNDLPDAQTVHSALTLARVGHLVIANANAASATQALSTICRALPVGAQPALSEQIVAVTNQRLLRKSDGIGRVPAYEVVQNTSELRESIRNGLDVEVVLGEMIAGSEETRTLPEVIARLTQEGGVTQSEADAALRDYPTF
ncbi:MAG: hypothetical protein H7145_10860, partial [Akkermansiaceae bacterium]|nr:hypothetical protein [Armatimonadota bacterium]